MELLCNDAAASLLIPVLIVFWIVIISGQRTAFVVVATYGSAL